MLKPHVKQIQITPVSKSKHLAVNNIQTDLVDILSVKCFDFDTGLSFKRSRLAQIVWRFDQDQTRSKFFHRFIEKHVSQNYEIFELVKNVFVKMPLTKLARRYHSQRRPKQQGRVCKNWKCVSFLIWKDVSCILDVEIFIFTFSS